MGLQRKLWRQPENVWYLVIRNKTEGMKKGYAQVLKDKSLNEQLGALKNQGCEKIYQERLASSWEERTQLAELIANLRSGDVVVICRFSIIARSLKQLLTWYLILKSNV